MMEHELEPWILLTELSGVTQPAFWQVSQGQAASLALFSTAERAQAYAAALVCDNFRVNQPSRVTLISLLVECYKQGIRIAVLDPDASAAKRVFDIQQILKAAKVSFAPRKAPTSPTNNQPITNEQPTNKHQQSTGYQSATGDSSPVASGIDFLISGLFENTCGR